MNIPLYTCIHEIFRVPDGIPNYINMLALDDLLLPNFS